MAMGHGNRRFLWVFSTFAVGGAQRRFISLLPAWGRDTHHLIFAMDGNYEAERLLPEGATASRLEAPVRKGGFISIANIAAFRRLLRAVQPDVLLTSNWGTIEWHIANRGRSARPHIHFEDGFGAEESIDKRLPKRDAARRLLFSQRSPGAPARRFVAPSHGLAHLYETVWGAGAQTAPDGGPGHVWLIPNGIDIDAFDRGSRDQEARGKSARPFTIGTVGALRREKRYDRLIRAFAMLMQTETADSASRLVIVGDGPERQSLEALARSSGIGTAVKFTGEQSDIASHLADIDVFTLTSDTEQMPISLIEAMAARCACVATDVGDIRAMAPDIQGRFILPLTEETALTASLAEAFATLRDDADLRNDLAAANRARVEIYSFSHMAERYRALIDDVCRAGDRR